MSVTWRRRRVEEIHKDGLTLDPTRRSSCVRLAFVLRSSCALLPSFLPSAEEEEEEEEKRGGPGWAHSLSTTRRVTRLLSCVCVSRRSLRLASCVLRLFFFLSFFRGESEDEVARATAEYTDKFANPMVAAQVQSRSQL